MTVRPEPKYGSESTFSAVFVLSRSFRVESLEPRLIRRVPHQLPVVIGCPIAPPRRAAFAQGVLGGVDLGAGVAFGLGGGVAASLGDGAAGVHQGGDMADALFFRQGGITATPQAAADHEVATVGGDRVLGGWAGHGRSVRVGRAGGARKASSERGGADVARQPRRSRTARAKVAP